MGDELKGVNEELIRANGKSFAPQNWSRITRMATNTSFSSSPLQLLRFISWLLSVKTSLLVITTISTISPEMQVRF